MLNEQVTGEVVNMFFFQKKKEISRKRAQLKKEGDKAQAQLMDSILHLDRETEKLENDINYRIFVAIGGKQETKK